MFNQIHQQNLADMIKANADRISTPAPRRIAIEAIQAFESAGWNPQALEQAVDDICEPDEFIFDGDQVKIEHAASRIIPRVLYHYLTLIGAGERLTLKQAQEWLCERGLGKKNGQPYSLIAIKKAVEREHLPARLENAPTPYNTVTKEDLLGWAFEADTRKPGPKTE